MRKAILASGWVVLGFILVAACGSDGDDAPAPAADSGVDTGNASGFLPTDSGGSSSGSAEAGNDAGPAACPIYQSLCDGKCINTSDDPDHCGDCTTKCTGANACSAGKCSDKCEVGLDICANRCVDKQSDNAHCGTCGHACGPGDGCVAGNCVKAIPVGPAPDKCVGGGPPISISAEQGGCLGNLAATTFRWSLCSCKDVNVSALLSTDAYDSTKGPYAPGSTGGGVGVNNHEQSSSQTTVGGDLWIHGAVGASFSAAGTVRHDLKVNGPFSTSSTFTIENDAFVNGDVTTSKTIAVTNELTVPADKTLDAPPKVTAGKTTRAPVDFPLPCDCTEKQLVPVVAIVQAHAGTNNDNATINLKEDALKQVAGPTRLDLPCGQFYLTEVSGSKAITINAQGRVALYIAGDVATSADITFAVAPTGELDLFVGGTISSSAPLHIGSPNHPALSRTYLGTTNTLGLSANFRVGGNVWVGNGLADWSASADLYGSLFAGDFHASAATVIHYDRAVLQAGQACGGAGSGTGGGDAGGGCTSCRDCVNQACKAGKCGACETSADCCSPLQCVLGECIPAVK